MKLEAFSLALQLAAEDDALVSAIEAGDSLSLSLGEDGSVSVSPAGGEPVVIPAEALMGDSEGDDSSAEPMPNG